MAVLDKIFFWRKKEEPIGTPGEKQGLGLPGEEELGLRRPTGLEEPSAEGLAPSGFPPEAGVPSETPMPGQMPRAMPSHEPPETPTLSPTSMPPGYASQPQMPSPMSKDLELISAKLDTIKAGLDNLNQRLANLEKAAKGEHEIY